MIRINLLIILLYQQKTLFKNKTSSILDNLDYIKEFSNIYFGYLIIVNASFNVRSEPIVNTPSDAFNWFMGTNLDYLVIGNCFLDRRKQFPELQTNYDQSFEFH